MLSRFQDWPERLEVYLQASRARRFRYGQWDCSLFVADAIQAMTGVDIAARFRCQYGSRREALLRITEAAGKPSVEAVAEHVASNEAMAEVPIGRAARGDMALIRRARDFSLGIVAMNGSHIWIALRNGIGAVPLDRACRAWRV